MMEAVSVAVGILPLMVSVAENYKKLFLTPLARYRNFTDEASKYMLRLENQQAIFQTQCILLLSTVVDTPTASQILGALSEQAEATKAEVEERLLYILDDSHMALTRTIEAINAALEATQRDCEELSNTVKEEHRGKKVRTVCQIVDLRRRLTSARKGTRVI